MIFRFALISLSFLVTFSAFGQTKRMVSKTELNALESRMISGQAIFQIADSLFNAYQKEPFDIEGTSSTVTLLWSLFDRADEMSGSCKLCSERKDSVRAVSEREIAIEIEQQYQKVLAAGEKCLIAKDYSNALKYFTRAANFKPSDPLPKAKVEEIAQQLSSGESTEGKSEEEIHFHNLILLGDYLFNSKLYGTAQEYYILAALLKPDDPYLNQKMAENDTMLEQQKHD